MNYGAISLDCYACRLYLDGEDIGLGVKEYLVLRYLLLSSLRKKLHMSQRTDIEIENEFGAGYRMMIREAL